MTVDHRSNYIDTVRAYLSVLVYPIQYVVNFPIKASQWLSTSIGGQMQLLKENAYLREENRFLQFSLQKFQDLKNENNRLRKLLNASQKLQERITVAEIIAIDVDPTARKILIDKGTTEGVYDGQPLLDSEGVMGKVTHAGLTTSVVTLITDPSHDLPVQNVRTGLRAIARGKGAFNRLELLYLPNNADIMVGDLLVTAGIGFPTGYPVGKVAEFNPDISRSYAEVQIVPSSLLERNREVLLVVTPLPTVAPDKPAP